MCSTTGSWWTIVGSILLINNYTSAQFCHMSQRRIDEEGILLCSSFVGTLTTDAIEQPAEKIGFEKNQLTAISSASFTRRFSIVTKLYLDNNKITNITADGLENLPNLELIDLSHNNIKALNPNVFSSNKKLKVVNLTANQIRVLSLTLIKNLNHLEEFILSGNPLEVCDRETKQVLKHFEEQNVKTLFLPTCTIPELNETSDNPIITTDGRIPGKYVSLVIVFVIMIVLGVALLFGVIVLYYKISKKYSSIPSGNGLLHDSASSDDGDGYLIPNQLVSPIYVDVLYSSQNLKLAAPLLPSKSDVNNHVYAEPAEISVYARNLQNSLPKPFVTAAIVN